MDDWDYLIIMEDTNDLQLEPADPNDLEFDTEQRWEPIPGGIQDKAQSILRGCYDNRWHRITWEGKPVVLGIAYHS